MLTPVLWYVRHFPFVRGKGLLIRWLIVPSLPRDKTFMVDLSIGGRIKLNHRETLGLSTILYGPFEKAEIEYIYKRAKPDTMAIDVGANIGLFSIAFARAVGPGGQVLAVEPFVSNIERLKENIKLNDFKNICVYHCAAADSVGEIELKLADDPAYASTTQVAENRYSGNSIKVSQRTLDDMWTEQGQPSVSVIKLDIEGGEVNALRGAVKLIMTCHPMLMIEANTDAELEEIKSILKPLGYSNLHPDFFAPWNHIFLYVTQ